MKKIPLTRGKFALVDDDDYEILTKHKWYAHKEGGTHYAVRSSPRMTDRKRTHIIMHRIIMQPPCNTHVDHVDGNGLNNTKKNLRVCTNSQNQANTKKRNDNTSGFKGVVFCRERPVNSWKAQIRVHGKQTYLGYFSTQKEANDEYTKTLKKIHGQFARI